MRRLLLLVCVAATATAGAAWAGPPRFGVAEDLPKYAEDGGASLYPKLTAIGMVQNRFTVRWNPADPTTIQERSFLDRSLPAAARAGIRVILAVYPADPSAFASDVDTQITLFTTYLQTLARTYPEVTDYVVGNEPNEAFFWQPQLGPAGEQLSAPVFERLLAASYDVLKGVNPGIRVIAAGPSGEGNDRTSTSPVRFLRALGDAYRASGRAAPIMDALAFHVYPRTNTDPPSRQYGWPNAGASDLARVKQAVWDAFAGTAQPIFPEGPAAAGNGALALVVDEFGWQAAIDPALAGRYTGAENVPAVSEDDQARFYAELVRLLGCDAAVTDAMVFHLVDEADLARFQSGLLRVDGSERPSYGAMHEAIAAVAQCGAPMLWAHTTGVIGAAAAFGERNHPARRAIFGISATAAEDAQAKVGIFAVAGPKARPNATELARSLASTVGTSSPVKTAEKTIQANYTPRFEFRGRLRPGWYVYGIRLTAAMNPARSETLVSRVFRVDPPKSRK